MNANADEATDIAREGHRAYKREDYAKACRRFQEAADQGDAWAQSWLGFMYWKGLGVERGDAEACRWYRRAADQGYAWAQRRLGSMYEFGKGVERSIPKACHLYELAASQGDTWAQDALRSMR